MKYFGWIAVGVLCGAGVSFAGRPLAIDDADPADVGQFELEAGVACEHESDYEHWDFPAGLAYGAIRNVEVGIGFNGQFEERTELLEDGTEECVREEGVGDFTAGMKWLFLESCPLGARHAIVPSVKFPTADEDKDLGSGKTDYDLMWVASRSIGDTVSVHFNLGYSWIGGPDDDVLHYGAAIDLRIAEAMQWVGEAFAERELVGGSDTVAQFNTGFRWNPMESLTLDMAG